MKKIIGIGNALVDALYSETTEELLATLALPKGSMQLIDRAHFLALGERMSGARRERTTGGSACNTILALARVGQPTALIGKVGHDDDGDFFGRSFREAGVETHLLTDDAPTGVASAFITPDGQRTFATYLGAAAHLKADDIAAAWWADCSYLYIEGYLVQNHALIDTLVDTARAAGLLVALDMASYNVVEADRDFFGHLLQKTDIVFANEEEARAFTGCEADEALDALAEICPLAVVKVGPRGALARRGSEKAFVPAGDAVKVVDTTAAGDYFAAGFLHAHARGEGLEACLSEGTLLANEIIQVVGTRLDDSVWQKMAARL
jgi:sugar/nucleoside kinase (ribokinase family)